VGSYGNGRMDSRSNGKVTAIVSMLDASNSIREITTLLQYPLGMELCSKIISLYIDI
jgi:hypothetical protein